LAWHNIQTKKSIKDGCWTRRVPALCPLPHSTPSPTNGMLTFPALVSVALALAQLSAASIPANTPTALRIVTGEDNTTNCLTAGGSSNGASVSVQACSQASSDAQNSWIFPSGIPDSGPSPAQNVRYGNLCLDVTGGVDAAGTKAQLWTCNSGNKNQQWVINVNGNTATLQWAGDNKKCLVNTAGHHDGTQASIETCSSGDPDQDFTPINASRTSPPGTPIQFGHGKDRKTCFGVDALQNGAPVVVTPCEPENNQRNVWSQSTANGPITIGNTFCLDVTDGKNTNGNPLQIWTCAKNSSNQKWTIGQDLTIQWTGKGKCVDLTNGSVTAGNRLQLWTCSAGNTNQQWVNLPPI